MSFVDMNTQGMAINEQQLYQKIGQHIRQKREEARLTQGQLAEAVGILRTSITNLEAGRQKVPLHLLYELCAVLKVDIQEILPGMNEITDLDIPNIEIGGRLTEVPPKSAELINALLNNND